MNERNWNVGLMSEVDGLMTVAVSAPNVTREQVEDAVGSYMMASVGDGFKCQEHALEMVRGDDGKGGLVYDRLVMVTLSITVHGWDEYQKMMEAHK
jgi:hypothetical protein